MSPIGCAVVAPPNPLRASAQVAPTEPDNYLTWPKGDSLFSYMSTRQFAHFNVLLLFGSVVIAGLGSEVVVGQYIVEHMDPEAAAALWVYAQVHPPFDAGRFSEVPLAPVEIISPGTRSRCWS